VPCEREGLELFQSFVKERDSSEEFVHLELRPFEGGLTALEKECGDYVEMNPDRIDEFKKMLNELPYPEPDEDDEDDEGSNESELELRLSQMTSEEKLEWFMQNYKDPGA